MRVDFDIIYRSNRARQGDLIAACELIDYYSLNDDWNSTSTFFQLIVDFKPENVEKVFSKITGRNVSYEMMLALIGQNFYENGNYTQAYRWYQKYLDYLDYKNASVESGKWLSEKSDLPIYKILQDAQELDKIENRFLLKWEQELFYKKR